MEVFIESGRILVNFILMSSFNSSTILKDIKVVFVKGSTKSIVIIPEMGESLWVAGLC